MKVSEFSQRTVVSLIVILFIFLGAGFYYFNLQHEKTRLIESYNEDEKLALDVTDAAFFPTELIEQTFWSKGEQVNCLYLGETAPYYNAVYYFKDSNNRIIEGQKPIVYIKPGDERYSHYWATFNVFVPNSYVANTVKSLEGILKAEKASDFRVVPTESVAAMALVNKNVSIENRDQYVKEELEVYYNARPATMLKFEDNIIAFDTSLIDHIAAVAVHRTSEDTSSFEIFEGIDINEDEDVKDSQVLIDIKKGESPYSPLHKLSYIYVNDNFPALGEELPWTSFAEMVQNTGNYIDFNKGAGGLQELGKYFTCIQ